MGHVTAFRVSRLFRRPLRFVISSRCLNAPVSKWAISRGEARDVYINESSSAQHSASNSMSYSSTSSKNSYLVCRLTSWLFLYIRYIYFQEIMPLMRRYLISVYDQRAYILSPVDLHSGSAEYPPILEQIRSTLRERIDHRLGMRRRDERLHKCTISNTHRDTTKVGRCSQVRLHQRPSVLSFPSPLGRGRPHSPCHRSFPSWWYQWDGTACLIATVPMRRPRGPSSGQHRRSRPLDPSQSRSTSLRSRNVRRSVLQTA